MYRVKPLVICEQKENIWYLPALALAQVYTASSHQRRQADTRSFQKETPVHQTTPKPATQNDSIERICS
jgi:hypothetical protein